MLQLSNGDLLMYGFTEVEEGSRYQYAIRIGTDGEVLWEYIGSRPDAEEELILDAIELETAEILLIVNADEDSKLVSLDQEGSPQWEKRFEIPGWQFFSTGVSVEGGDLLLARFWMNDGPPSQVDTWLARCTAKGEIVWEKTIGNPDYNDYAQSLIELSDGNYLIGGLGKGMPLTQIDADGNILWQQRPLESGTYNAGALLETNEGILVAGFIMLVNGRSYDAFLAVIEISEMED